MGRKLADGDSFKQKQNHARLRFVLMCPHFM